VRAIPAHDPAAVLARDERICGSGRPACGFSTAQSATIVAHGVSHEPAGGTPAPTTRAPEVLGNPETGSAAVALFVTVSAVV
jgi:hypothetical protein